MPQKEPGLGFRPDLASTFMLLGASCVALGNILALSEPQVLQLSSGDDHPVEGL